MKIQSLSIVVPAGCPNKCKFCVSVLHPNPYTNQIEKNTRFRDLYKKDFLRRMEFARDNGCNTLMLTGNGEPLMNKDFLNYFAEWNEKLTNPFKWIELQTSGVTLDDEKLRWLRNEIGVNTISLSLSSLVSERNAEINQTPEKLTVKISELCSEIKRYDFNLRMSLNMTDWFNFMLPEEIFSRCKQLGADQIIFRVLYSAAEDDLHGVNEWIREHKANSNVIMNINAYIHKTGRELERLPFGAMRYSVDGMSVVLDDDCMSTTIKNETEQVKYLILQPNCKLYTKWDDPGSLLF